MKNTHVALVLIFAAVVSYATTKLSLPDNYSASKAETVYDRVMRTGTLRCGYIVYNPSIISDKDTGQLSGLFYDLTEAAGEKLNLKVEWVQEAGWATFLDDLKTDRYDMLCSVLWPNSKRAKFAEFIEAGYYSSISTWVRADEGRFETEEDLNHPEFTMATIDGTSTEFFVMNDFPNAQTLSLPELSAVSDLILNVANRKADATVVEDFTALDYIRANGEVLKRIGNPIRVFPNAMAVKKGEFEFASMIKSAVDEVLMTGFLDDAFKKYNVDDGVYLKGAKVYELED